MLSAVVLPFQGMPFRNLPGSNHFGSLGVGTDTEMGKHLVHTDRSQIPPAPQKPLHVHDVMVIDIERIAEKEVTAENSS